MSTDDSTTSHDDERTATDTKPSDSPPADDAPKLVVEVTAPAGAFVLAETLQAAPETIVEFEQFVPVKGRPLPYLWSRDTDVAAFEAAAADPTVETVTCVATFEESALYEIEWAESPNSLLGWLRDRDAVLLQTEARNDGSAAENCEWLLKLRIDSRDVLGDLQSYCDDCDISFQLERLYELTDPKIGQFNVSEKQRELLIVGLEMGLFEIPRETTLEEVAEAIGISPKAASERLRRDQTNLISNTLTIGQPTGIGVGVDE